MAPTKDFDRYVAACDYPGELNEAVVESSLRDYLAALGVTREVRRLRADWDLATEEPLRRSVWSMLDDVAKRIGWKKGDARAALAARDARAALAARDARAALAARDALDALAARDARAARAARDEAHGALRRFAAWCIQRGWWWYSWDLSWIALTLIGAQQTGKEIPWARPLFEAYVAGCWCLYWTDDTLYWVAKPAVHIEQVDAGRRLHAEDRAAIESDVENLYFWHGVLVPAFVVVRPDWITAEHVTTEENAEVRRVMLERFGTERYLRELGAKPIHTDACGTLYRVELTGDEALTMVEVVNSTPEPDGSWKKYMLRVHPELRPLLGPDRVGDPQQLTARNAVASSFGMRGEDYAPVIET